MSASLLERLAELADPRGRNGRQYPFVPLLALCLVAILAGHTTPTAISEFGRLRRHRLGHALGFTRGTMPCPNTITNLLAALDRRPPPLGGAVVTADAMFTHADVCHAVRGRGGEYTLYAKGNQEALRDDLEAAFTTPESGVFSPLPAGRVG